MKRIGFSIFVMCCALAVPAWAWSNKEHIELTRIAAQKLVADPQTPAAMKDWLKAACPKILNPQQEREYFLKQRVGLFPRGVDGLLYWSTEPDLLASLSDRKIEPFGVNERMLHYVDLEQFNKEE